MVEEGLVQFDDLRREPTAFCKFVERVRLRAPKLSERRLQSVMKRPVFAERRERSGCSGGRDADGLVLYHRLEWRQSVQPSQQRGQIRHLHESNVGEPMLSDVPTEEEGSVPTRCDHSDRGEGVMCLTFSDQALEARLRL